MACLQMSLYFLSLIFLSKAHLTLSFNDLSVDPGRTFLRQSTIDVHDILPVYGLPRGLLPDNVKSYTLSPTGSFSIELKSPCYVHFDRLVYYDKQIKGKLTYGAVNDVSGIQAKKLFIWVSVSDIQVSKDGGMIEFFVGPLSEKLPAAQFTDIPACKSKAALRANLESM